MITLTTDLDDVYVAQMKGAILSLNSSAGIVDISHDTKRFNVRRASFSLMCAARIFPRDVVHVCVVDPGVGSSRRGLIVSTGDAYFVGPDNGVFTLPLSLFGDFDAFSIDPQEVKNRTKRPISNTFHGRDLFAPAAALLDLGEKPDRLAQMVEDIEVFHVTEPVITGNVVEGMIIFVDGFGNLVTNIPGKMLKAQPGSKFVIHLGGKTFPCTSGSCYANAEPGQLILLVGSQDTYEVSLNRGSAHSLIGGAEGDEIRISLED